MKNRLKTFIFNTLVEPSYVIYHALKDLVMQAVDLLAELKKPKTWQSIIYIVAFYAILKKDKELFTWLVPVLILIYLLRYKVEGRHRHDLRVNAYIRGNDIIIMSDYEKYKRECKFMKKESLDYDVWKEIERKKYINKDQD